MTAEVWCLCEVEEGGLGESAQELCALAYELGQQVGAAAAAVIPGEASSALAREAAGLGIARIYVLQDPTLATYNAQCYTHALRQLLDGHSPQLFLFAGDIAGVEVAAALAAHSERPLVVNAAGFELNGPDEWVIHQSLFGNRAHAHIRMRGPSPYFVACRGGAFGVPERRRDGLAEIVRFEPHPLPEARVRRRELIAEDYQSMDIGDAERVVAGGLGFDSKEAFQLLWRLADLLRASVGVTRPLVDIGWEEFERQIGTTGKVISPRLYIAAGVSGATQHTSGIVNPGAVMAVNIDPGAPIFEMADLGLIGDLHEILPHLIEKLEAARSEDHKREQHAR